MTMTTIEQIRTEANANTDAILDSIADCAAGLATRGLIGGEQAIAIAHAATRRLSQDGTLEVADGAIHYRVTGKLKALRTIAEPSVRGEGAPITRGDLASLVAPGSAPPLCDQCHQAEATIIYQIGAAILLKCGECDEAGRGYLNAFTGSPPS
jgi:hypothetical protein